MKGVISNELRSTRCELVLLYREGCLMPLNSFTFSVLKHLPRVKCVSLVGGALAVNLIKDVAAQTRHASITPTV